eukprot:jgi/Tetstr1/445574/TSEL_033347.t2
MSLLASLAACVSISVDSRTAVRNVWIKLGAQEWGDKNSTDLLNEAIEAHAPDYHPPPADTDIKMVCLAGTPHDRGLSQDCTAFLLEAVTYTLAFLETRTFFGKKKLGQKADRPNVPKSLEYLSTALSGNGNWVQKGNWPSIIALLKALELSLFRYEEQLGKQRDYDLKSKLMEEPLRSAETASHVETIEALKALAPNLLKGKYVRGVVTCKDCMRPRCLYSLTHPRNMEPAATMVDGKKVQPSVTEKAECKQYALQNFHAAAEHNSFLCGMQPFDDDHPLHGVLVTRSNITCGSPVEFEYYSTQTERATWFDATTCA